MSEMAAPLASVGDETWISVFKLAIATFLLIPGLYAFALGFGGQVMWTGVMIVAELGIIAVGLAAVYFSQQSPS